MDSVNFRYKVGDLVKVKDAGESDLYNDGDVGVIFNFYHIDPPAYEVTFRDKHGKEFDVLLTEAEIEAVSLP